MYSMPAEAAENEPDAPKHQRENPNFHLQSYLWAVGTLTILLIYTVWKFSSSEEYQLKTLHTLVKLLQYMARLMGAWALNAEARYNQVVDTLH
jgi:hypothetical protein